MIFFVQLIPGSSFDLVHVILILIRRLKKSGPGRLTCITHWPTHVVHVTHFTLSDWLIAVTWPSWPTRLIVYRPVDPNLTCPSNFLALHCIVGRFFLSKQQKHVACSIHWTHPSAITCHNYKHIDILLTLYTIVYADVTTQE